MQNGMKPWVLASSIGLLRGKSTRNRGVLQELGPWGFLSFLQHFHGKIMSSAAAGGFRLPEGNGKSAPYAIPRHVPSWLSGQTWVLYVVSNVICVFRETIYNEQV